MERCSRWHFLGGVAGHIETVPIEHDMAQLSRRTELQNLRSDLATQRSLNLKTAGAVVQVGT
jgi:hypothetical protein